ASIRSRPSPSSVVNCPGLLVRMTYTFGQSIAGHQVFLGQLEVVVDPELAAQAVAELQPLADQRLLLPVRLGKVLAALEDLAHAGAALPHAAAVLEVRIGTLVDARQHHEVGVVHDLALVHLAALVDGYFRHLCIQKSAFCGSEVDCTGMRLLYCIQLIKPAPNRPPQGASMPL